jgi:hypothetical protein
MADLTRSDFGELTDSLNSAREAIRDNDPAGALGDLGSETEVFMIRVGEGGENSPGGQQLLMVLNDYSKKEDIRKVLTAFAERDSQLYSINFRAADQI